MKTEEAANELCRERPVLETPRLWLRMATEQDVPHILDYYERNREHFAPTSPRGEEFFTEPFWIERVAKSLVDFECDRAVRLFLYRKPDEQRVIGTTNFSEIIRGPLQACFLGYDLDGELQGQGLMTEGLPVAIEYMFREFNIHRVMAGYVPTNERSAGVLRRLGFAIEGYARDYLLIAGKWHDHILTGLTNPQWKEPDHVADAGDGAG